MIDVHTRTQFRGSIIAQQDDNDYSESGWVACVVGNEAALARYSHCSCYGTWESMNSGGVSDYFDDENVFADPSWNWNGTADELVQLAARKADPNLPERDADPKDYDYAHLMAVYDQILAWDRTRPR